MFTSDQEESCKVLSELEAELELLRTTLEMKGVELQDTIKGEKQRKETELQVKGNSILQLEVRDFCSHLLSFSETIAYL